MKKYVKVHPALLTRMHPHTSHTCTAGSQTYEYSQLSEYILCTPIYWWSVPLDYRGANQFIRTGCRARVLKLVYIT
jgi:hypothetical protein